MNVWTVFVRHKPGAADHRGQGIQKEAAHAGLKGLKKVVAGQAYALEGVDEAAARVLAAKLLADPVTQEAAVLPPASVSAPKGARLAQIWPKPGVSDPVADTVRLAARDLKVQGLSAVRSGHVFEFHGAANPADVRRFCEEHLMNALVQRVEVL